MIKTLIIVGLLAFAATKINWEITPEQKKELMSHSRKALGFVNRNSKVTDEYLRCLELQPTQPEWCKTRFLQQAKDANPVDVAKPLKVSVTKIGIGTVSVKAEPDTEK